MKRILTAAVLVALISPSAMADNFSGAYAGLQAGIAGAKVASTSDGSATNYGQMNMIANLVGGYGEVMNDSFYVGGEAAVGSGAGDKDLSKEDKTTYKGGQFFTLGGRLGWLITQKAMAFFSLAAGMEKQEVGNANATPPLKKSALGMVLIPGIGTEVAMSDSLSFRLDAQYKVGRKVEARSTSGTLTTISAKSNQVIGKVGLTYRF